MRFEKVSLAQYLEANKNLGDTNEELLKKEWEEITLPTRATLGSAGYDFYAPMDMYYNVNEEPRVYATGIRVILDPGYMLVIVPRSGLGFKYGMRLENTLGVIDSDYQFADNEGHIMVKFRANKDLYIEQGSRFLQGIIVPIATIENDMPLKVNRTGGFGSTGGV